MAQDRPFGATELWEALASLDSLLAAVIAHPRAVMRPGSYKQATLLLLMAKAIKTYRAILILCRSGYGEDAMLLLRCLFELVVTAQYLVQTDSRRRMARYRAYNDVVRAQLMRPRWREPDFVAEYTRRGRMSQRAIESAAQRARARFGFSSRASAFGWAGVSLADAAKLVGQEGGYDSLYRLSSQFEHSMVWSISTYRRDGHADASPSDQRVNQTLATAYFEMLVLTEVIVRAFNIGLLRQVKQVARLAVLVREAGRGRP